MPDYFAGRVDDETLPQRLLDAKVKFSQEIPDTASSLIFELLVTLVFPLLMFGILINFVMRRMSKGSGMMGIGKSNAKVYVEKETGVTFQDVAGQDEAKESLQEVVDFLHNPGKYTGIGAKLPKGAPLADLREPVRHFLQKRWQEKRKCRSSHCRVPHLWRCMSVSERPVCVTCSNRHSRWRRVSYLSMRLNATGKSRDTAMGGGNDEREQTLNQLLAEMDGFDTNKGLLLLAATNRPEVLDPALLRPGRFDRRIIVDKPDLKGRIDTLKVHSKDVKMDETVDLEAIALATSGAVVIPTLGRSMKLRFNAVKNGRQVVSQKDLFEAVEVVLVGKEKK